MKRAYAAFQCVEPSPYLCKTNHCLAELMHARLIRTKAEALCGDHCDYWYVGGKSPAPEEYKGLKQI